MRRAARWPAPSTRRWRPTRRLEGLRRRAGQATDREAARDQRARAETPRRDVLPQRQRAQGIRGQDLPRRDRRQPRLPWGQAVRAGDPAQHLLRLVPRGLRARPVRGVDRAGRGRRPRHRPGRDALPVRAPAAARRVVPAQQPRQRQGRAGLVRDAARRGLVPDPDGRAARADRRRLYTDHVRPAANFLAAHGPAFGVERWEEQSGYSPSTIAAEIAGLSPRPRSPTPTAILPRPRSGAASPTTCSARSRTGR